MGDVYLAARMIVDIHERCPGGELECLEAEHQIRIEMARELLRWQPVIEAAKALLEARDGYERDKTPIAAAYEGACVAKVVTATRTATGEEAK